jgi:glycosyltransferase involved in cell wall biosynthesis
MGLRALTVGPSFDLVHVHAHPARITTSAPIVMSEGSSVAVYLADYLGWPAARMARRFGRARRLYRWLRVRDRLLNQQGVARVYVFSEWARSINLEWGADPGKIVVVPPGFATPAPVERRQREKFTFLFIGTDFGRKGGFDVVEAFDRVVRDAPNTRLRLVTVDPRAPSPDPLVREWATPARRERVLAQLDTLVATGVATVGPLVDRDGALAAEYAGADAFVMPTLAEGFGFTNVEAKSFGLPLITSNLGPMPEVVRAGVDGLLVPPGNVDALTTAMMHLASDAARAREMGARARADFEARFTLDVMRAGIGAVYRDALES